MDSNVNESHDVMDPSSALPRCDLVCKYCGRQFTIVQNLRRHMKNQHLGYRFPCASCNAEATRKEDIVRHYSMYHPDKMAQAYAVREVCKLTEGGKVKPLGRVALKRRAKPGTRKKIRLKSPGVELTNLPELDAAEDFLRLTAGTVLDSQSVGTSLQGETGETGRSSADAEQQRVVIALDPVTQFRLERVVAERVDRITEKSVVEILDIYGRVTRRETIEREYHLNSVEKS